jgi:hypothetical protein
MDVPVHLIDLGAQGGTYMGEPGGLMAAPQLHVAICLNVIIPQMVCDDNLMAFVGYSNLVLESQSFIDRYGGLVNTDLINVCRGGADVQVIGENLPHPNSGETYWDGVHRKFQEQGKDPLDVTVVFWKTGILWPERDHALLDFQEYIHASHIWLRQGLLRLKFNFPNCKMVLLGSRCHGRFNVAPAPTAGLHPEPYAYWEGFVVKKAIDRQMAGDPDWAFPKSRRTCRTSRTRGWRAISGRMTGCTRVSRKG